MILFSDPEMRVELLLMHHCQNILINVMKRLFLQQQKQFHFGIYIKYALGWGCEMFLHV